MKYPAYPKVKDSGVAWLGKVPEHWEMKRLKMSTQLADQKVEADEDNPVPYIGLENIESWSGKLLSIDPDAIPTGVANKFSEQNTLFGKLRPYLAKACNPDFDGLCSTELLVIHSKDFERRALLYWLLADGFVNLIDSSTYGSKMPRANWDFIGNCLLPVPPRTEQITIADFLDRETGRIDALIEKKRKLIALLEEKRSALISRTVTRGLPADVAKAYGLEPHTNFKDSGVEWLGKVPEDWEVKRLRFIARVQTGNTPSKSDEENYANEGLMWVKPDNLSGLTPITETKEYLSDIGEKLGRAIPPMSPLVCCIGTVGKLGFAVNEVATNQQINAIIFDDKKMESRFGFYLVMATESEHIRLANTNVVSILNSFQQSNISLPLPHVKEQTAIADYLDRETTKIDQLKAKIDTAIERLQEYRAALITAAVTGKIDVRQAA